MSTPLILRFPVRFRDVDVMGHVNNAVYFTYMETARTEYWMRQFGSWDPQGVSFIVAHAECDFKTAAKLGDEIEISVWTSSVGNTSFIWTYEMKNGKTGEIVAYGKTIQVYFDYRANRSLPVPEDVRKKLLQ
jgi:acyl-CoA thioester hydrolase